MKSEIAFSYIIPTIGRPSLETAVGSVLTQKFSHAGFEVVVVNDSGAPLPKADWQDSPRVRVIDTYRSERSFARNAGAATARGRYLAFLDDDDWLVPGALDQFWQLFLSNPQALWLYGGIRVVDENLSTLAELNSGLSGDCFAQIMGGAWAPIQSSVIQAQAFFDAGGFSPFICGTEDEDLCRRIAFRGEFANTAEIVACLYRGQAWNTSTNYLRAPQDTKYSRDLILSEPGAFQRLISTANASYWFGRILKVYISTISWNVKKKRFLRAASRLVYSLAVLVNSLRYVFSPGFWQGVSADHVPQSLHFVMKEYEQKIKGRGRR